MSHLVCTVTGVWWTQVWGAIWGGVSAAWAWFAALPWGVLASVAQVIGIVGLVVTLFFTRGQLTLTRRQLRESARSVARSRIDESNAADRAEASAAGTIDAMTRIAQGIEAVVARMPIEIRTTTATLSGEVGLSAQGVAFVPRAEWALTHYDGDRYQLENVGTDTAWDVHIGADPSMFVGAGPLTTDSVNIPPREAQTFIAARSMGTRDSTITVTWKASPDVEQDEVWRYPLPPKR